MRVVERVDLDTEQLHPPDSGAAVERAAQVVGVREHDFRHEEAERERDDGEVHATGSQRGYREDQPDRDREEDAEHDRQFDGEVGAHEPARDQRADAGERPLRERDLTGVPGQHDDRQDHDRGRQRGVRGLGPGFVHHPEQQHEDDGRREEDAADADLAGSELRQPLGHVRPQRQAPPAHDDHDQDHEERGHAVEPGDHVLVEEVLDVAAVERRHRLAHADDQAAEQGQWERLEATQQRGTEPGNGHHDRERRRGEPGERRGEHGGEPTERSADRPREGGETVG